MHSRFVPDGGAGAGEDRAIQKGSLELTSGFVGKRNTAREALWEISVYTCSRGSRMDASIAGNIKASELPKYILLALVFAVIPVIPILMMPISYAGIVVGFIDTIVFLMIVAMSLRSIISIIFGSRNTPKQLNTQRYPTVSIIVPSYNEEKVLRRTMRSMLELDYPCDKIEMIYVYESECTDKTEEIILEFAKKDPRIKPLRRTDKKAGKAAAANYGIQRASGEIIVSLDADHSLKIDALKRAVAWFQDPSVVCVKGRCRSMNKDASIIAKIAGVERDVVERLTVYSSYRMRGFSFFGGGQAFLRREIFDTLGLFDEETMTEDIDYSVKLHLIGREVVVDPRIESWEENPPKLTGWWHQRKRWARGWMQSARNHIGNVVRSKNMGLFRKMDVVTHLAFSILSFILPIMIPLIFIPVLRLRSSFFPEYLGFSFWIIVTFTPFMIGFTAWYLDVREGEPPRWTEIPYIVLLLLPYYIFHG